MTKTRFFKKSKAKNDLHIQILLICQMTSRQRRGDSGKKSFPRGSRTFILERNAIPRKENQRV